MLLVWWLPAAHAGTDSAGLSASATVYAQCFVSAGPLAFGTYDTVSGALKDAFGFVSFSCTAGVSATITLDQGLHADTGSTDAVPLRRVTDGAGHYLSYGTFMDFNATQVWGNDVSAAQTYTATDYNWTGYTVFGKMYSSQDVPAGTYTDTLVATVTF